jgi:hypothetical protein
LPSEHAALDEQILLAQWAAPLCDPSFTVEAATVVNPGDADLAIWATKALIVLAKKLQQQLGCVSNTVLKLPLERQRSVQGQVSDCSCLAQMSNQWRSLLTTCTYTENDNVSCSHRSQYIH